MTFYVVWLAASVAAFVLLRWAVLHEFRLVTRGGVVVLIALSLLTPVALMAVLVIALSSETGFFSKPIWKRP